MALTLLFHLGEMRYGLEIEAIQEVVENPVVQYVPRARGVLKGAINFHGRVLPVIDLPALLGFPPAAGGGRMLVLTAPHKALVLAVNGVERIAELDAAIQLPSASAADQAVRGLIEHEGEEVRLLDTGAVREKLEVL